MSRSVRLGDVVTIARGTTYKSALIGLDGPVLLGLGSIHRDGGFRDDSLRTYGGESPDRLLVRPGELYASLKDVTQSGDLLGAVARLPLDQKPGRLTQDTVRLDIRDQAVSPEYLYWILRTPQYRQYCRSHMTGTTNLGLRREDFFAFEFPVPTRALMELTATLCTLDDKIELNRQMNQTLDELARTIFRSWFVDFDPVRAKAEGREPEGMDAETAALFPERFVDSALGPIPEGWETEPLASFADVTYGAAFASSRFNSSGPGRPLLRIRDLPSQNPGVWTDETHPRGSLVEPGDIVVSMDGEFRAHLWAGPVSWLNQRVCKFKPKEDDLWSYVLYAIPEPLSFYERSKTGTTVIHLGKADIDSIKLIAAPATVNRRFSEIVNPLLSLRVANAQEDRTLAELRDTLLPELLSGRLRS